MTSPMNSTIWLWSPPTRSVVGSIESAQPMTSANDWSKTYQECWPRLQEEVRDAGQVEFDHVRNTEADPILDRIRKLLDGSVGIEPATDQLETDVKEGLRGVEDELPPGFKDKRKGDESAGDYLVWVQSLRECVDRTDTLVFVTGDSVGDDWYRREGSEIRGPRVELFDEARTKAGVRLYLLRPASLLKHAGAALRIEVEADTVASVEGVDSASAQAAWTNDNFADLLARLPIRRSGAAAGDSARRRERRVHRPRRGLWSRRI